MAAEKNGSGNKAISVEKTRRYKLVNTSCKVIQCSLICRGVSSKIIMQSFRKNLLVLSVVAIVSSAQGNDFSDCANSDNAIACRSMSLLSKAFNQVISNQNVNDESVKLLPGVEIIQNEIVNSIVHANDERSMLDKGNETILARLAKYLQTHDVKIKFSDMIGKADLQEVVNNVFNNDDPAVVGK